MEGERRSETSADYQVQIRAIIETLEADLTAYRESPGAQEPLIERAEAIRDELAAFAGNEEVMIAYARRKHSTTLESDMRERVKEIDRAWSGALDIMEEMRSASRRAR
jgi:hypothetical protein